MTGVTLIRAGAADLPQVMAVMNDAFDPAFGEAWTEAQCGGILLMPGVWMTLAARNGAPAGFSVARVVADEAELLLVAVRRDARRRGVGSALLRDVCEAARQRGARRVFLEMRRGNEARGMYEAAGFAPVGHRPNYYRGSTGVTFDALTLSHDVS